MTDGRRRRWVAHDVYFLDRPLGTALYDRFGAAGVALWFGFIAAAKKHHIEGRITYASDAEALTLFGLPGLALVDHDGQPFALDDFWRLLGDHKVTRRTARGRATQVVCTRWSEWQDPKKMRPPKGSSQTPRTSPADASETPNRPHADAQQALRTPTPDHEDTDTTSPTGQHHPWSGTGTTDTVQQDAPNSEREVPPDLDLDLDLDLDHDFTPLPPQSGGDPSPPGNVQPLNPRAAGTSPRQTGRNPRAAGKQQTARDQAASYGRVLATSLDRRDALERITLEYPDDPDLAAAAIDAYDRENPEAARG